MSISTSYLVTTKNLESFLNAIGTAQAPERFTYKFLEALGFTSSNDRLYIGLMKSLGFIDENGIPKERYYSFLDQTQSRKLLAEAIREAYGDLFALNIKANEMSVEEVKNKLRTLTQGKKTDTVLDLMAKTFRALSDNADWTENPMEKIEEKFKKQDKEEELNKPKNIDSTEGLLKPVRTSEFHYNIQIHLPESRDPSVYDALFKSLRDHLL